MPTTERQGRMHVEYHYQGEILQETMQTAPNVDVEIRNVATGPKTPLRLTCTVSGGDLATFDSTVSEDPTVAELKRLDCGDVRQLYWITAVPDTIDQRAYEAAVDSGGVYLESHWGDGGWYTTMNYPDRDCFKAFQRQAEEMGIDIDPKLIRCGQHLLSSGAFELTEKQEAVLATALAIGYFEIPREGSLSDVATDLGISRQAASERLRRAMCSLAQAAVTSGCGE